MDEKYLSFHLVPDSKGMIWDLLLYIPTVVILASIGVKLWYGGDRNFSYLLSFLASFFFIAGGNRILKTRLMLLPSAPVCLELDRQNIRLTQRDGRKTNLLKDQHFYPDYAGHSFGISGLDGSGKRLQFVFHRGQFSDISQYENALENLRRNFK
jgi:hypothetical protein